MTHMGQNSGLLIYDCQATLRKESSEFISDNVSNLLTLKELTVVNMVHQLTSGMFLEQRDREVVHYTMYNK